MNKNLKYLIMLLSVAVVLSMLVGSVSAAGRISPGGGAKTPGEGGGHGGLGLGSGVDWWQVYGSWIIIAIVAIVIVVAVVLIIKFVLPKRRQSS